MKIIPRDHPPSLFTLSPSPPLSRSSSTISPKMPSDAQVKAALALIKDDESKVLGLNVGKHKNVQPGQYVPRTGV